MDHLIEDFQVHIDWASRDFLEQWTSGKYKVYAECPSYYELKAIIDSVNILRVYYGWTRLTIRQIVELNKELGDMYGE